MITRTVYAYLGGAWVDITEDVTGAISGSTGIPSNRETDRIAKPGSFSFTLLNNSGTYTPGGVSAHADWKKGTPIKVDFSNPLTKTKFIGYVNSINLSYENNDKRASVTALDWFHYASNLPLNIPILQTNKRGDQILTTIVALSTIAPTSTSYQTGTQTFPYAFHDNTVKTTAFAEMSKIALSEWGYIYIKQDGTLKFEAYGGRSATQKTVNVVTVNEGFLLKEDGGYLLQENGDKLLLDPYSTSTADATVTTLTNIDLEYGERMANHVSAEIYPYRPGEETVLVYKHETPILLPAGETTSFRIQFTDPDSREPIAASAPVVKQYTLLHFDVPPDGVTGVQDEADLEISNYSTSLDYVSGAAITTSAKKFGTGSLVLNGTSDYVESSTTLEKYNFGGDDFTVDWWEYRLSASSGKSVISRSTSASFPPFLFGYSDGTNLRAFITSNGSSWDIANNKNMGTITTGAWTHYAITREGDTYRTYKNGVQQDTWTSSLDIYSSTDNLSIGKYVSNYFTGYIDEVRMIKGYAEYTSAFSVKTRQYLMSGINWSVEKFGGIDISDDITFTATSGGVGLDIVAVNNNVSDGYMSIQVFSEPLESLSPISHIAEDSTSITEYGYFSESIQMRLQGDIGFGKTIADAYVLAEKNPRTVLNKISMVTKDALGEALFMDCDIGDLIEVDDSLSGYNDFNHIQQISWRAIPGNGGVIVFYDWTLKEQ